MYPSRLPAKQRDSAIQPDRLTYLTRVMGRDRVAGHEPHGPFVRSVLNVPARRVTGRPSRYRDDRRTRPGRSLSETAKSPDRRRCGARSHDPSAARPARSAGQPRLWRDRALGPTRRPHPAQTRPRLAGGAVVGARRGRPRRSGRPTSRGSAPARPATASLHGDNQSVGSAAGFEPGPVVPQTVEAGRFVP